MVTKIQIKSIVELASSKLEKNDTRSKINCIIMNKEDIDINFGSSLYMNALTIVLVLNGTASVDINYNTHLLEKGDIILFNNTHMFTIYNCSTEFSCNTLFVSKDYMENMDATDMIYKRIRYGIKLYSNPVVKLNTKALELLNKRIKAVDDSINDHNHHFYNEMILNQLFAFYLDLSNIIEHQSKDLYQNANLSRYENIIKSFIELLAVNYRTEHKVEFYSSRLNITPHYLTLIVKQITGQTVNNLIFEMLYSEARNLLIHSRLSIQEIATQLHFSDQSSFGKFFKRKAGISPLEFRGNNK